MAMISSPPLLSRVTRGGTGTTTAAFRPSRVRPASPLTHTLPNTQPLVIWRSKTEELPDFSKPETEIGEVFFDVSFATRTSDRVAHLTVSLTDR